MTDYSLRWVVPSALLFGRVSGVLTAPDIYRIDRELIQALNDAQPHPVFVLGDMSRVTRLAVEPSLFLQGAGYFRHPYFRGTVVYGLSPEVKAYSGALMRVMNHMSRRHYHITDTYAQAVAVLEGYGITVPSAAPPALH